MNFEWNGMVEAVAETFYQIHPKVLEYETYAAAAASIVVWKRSFLSYYHFLQELH